MKSQIAFLIALSSLSFYASAIPIFTEANQSLDLYYVDCGEYPESLDGLTQAVTSCRYWGPSPYLNNLPRDPWGQPLKYERLSATAYKLTSLGSDQKPSEDDVHFASDSQPSMDDAKIFYAKTDSAHRYAVDKLSADDLKTAIRVADELLLMAKRFGNDWNYGNATHFGHIIRGRVYLLNGNLSGAKAELALAAQTSGSPQLDSFGPNFTLAEELYAKGEKAAVEDYIKNCFRFWSSKYAQEKVAQWMADLAKGERPNFKRNWAPK